MQIDELRSELTTLANEIQPFEGDVQGLHRHERRRRVITSSFAAALVAVVAVATIAVVHHRSDNRVRVTGTGSKEVPASGITHIDLIVVPATPAVRDVLNASPLVARYAAMPRGRRVPPGDLADPPPLRAPVCALESFAGFAVDVTTSGSGARSALAREIPASATVYDVSDYLGFDADVFLKVGAAPGAAANVRRTLEADPQVESLVDITQADAYDIFKKDFADQPALVRSTKPADLPESFRIDVRAGVSLHTFSERYQNLAGVDTVINAVRRDGLAPLPAAQLVAPATACAKP